jgi:hypothetical protein
MALQRIINRSGSVPPFASRGPWLGQGQRGWARICRLLIVCSFPSRVARVQAESTGLPLTALPHLHPILLRLIQLVSRLYPEGRIPPVDVADRGGPVLRWGVAVGQDLISQGGLARLPSPGLGKADEELLVTAEALTDGAGLPSIER